MMDAEGNDGRVGYGRPPAEHRFKKGQSGNPNGRRKGAKNVVPSSQRLDFGSQPANRMLLEEAYRTITVREGEKLVELPVIKAVFRALGMSAMKGNRLAQATMAELIRGIEEEDRKLRVDHFDMACKYKWDWEQAIEEARRTGQPEPTPLPHPDDVIINPRTADVRFAGPMTPEEKERWDHMLEFRDEEQTIVSHFAEKYRKTADTETRAREGRLDGWYAAQERFDRLNDVLPERYQKRLQDRSYISASAPAGEHASVADKRGSRKGGQS